MKQVMLIVNPTAGNESAQNFLPFIKDKLLHYFDEVSVKLTQAANDACNFAKEAAQSHFDSVIVMGGDGTVNEAISGLAELPFRPKFGLIPLGTVNDLARSLAIPLDPQHAIEHLDFNRSQKISIGKINGSYFSNVVAIGDIPTAVQDTSIADKTRLGKLAYLLNGAKSALKLHTYTFQIEFDGQSLAPFESSLVLLGLTNSIAGFEGILPEANQQNGYIHLTYLKDKTLLDRLASLPDLIGGIDSETDRLGYQKIKHAKISIQERETIQVNIDGDPGPYLPIEVEVLPHHLEVYCG